MLIIGILKLTSGFLIGSLIGKICAKNEVSVFIGALMTVVTVIITCSLIDNFFGIG